jgi:hypothetical protein
MKRIGLIAALLLLFVSPLHAQLSGVTAALQLDQDEYLPDEDLQLKVRITNRSGQDLILGTDNQWISVVITGDNNFICPKLGDMPVQGEFSLLSGEVGTRTLNPAPYFDFRKIGRYRLTARVRIPQWGEEITCKPVFFTVGYGIPLPSLANLQVGLPPAPGVSNAPPEIRFYSLLKASRMKDSKLYFRLNDSTGKTLKLFPLARLISFSDPEGQIDRYNNFHVLTQIGAKAFSYCVLNPDGRWLERETFVYSATRPVLHEDTEGHIYVTGGARQLSFDDFPPPISESAQSNQPQQ